MPYLQFNGQQFPLAAGDTVIGTEEVAHVRLEGPSTERARAVVARQGGDQVTIRRGAPDALVRVNGVPVGAEPIPLIHGDKIEIAAQELFFGDDRRAGSTQVLSGVVAGMEGGVAAGLPSRPTAATGGRLISLVDGKEYLVPAAGLVLGRDATCDVVVPSTAVSRKHAVIAPREDGYLITDVSSNGLLVNGLRPSAPQLLGRGDVIRIGDEEFRFSADNAPPSRPALATLEIINEGVLKGRRYEIRSALAHIGRGPHNDVVIPDESVSDAHAKLQRREVGWFVVDMGSTNGSYVAGYRVQGEMRLDGAPDLRFGGVKMLFRPADAETPTDAKGTRKFVAANLAQAGLGAAADAQRVAPRSAPRTTAAAPEAPPQGIPIALWLMVVVLLVAAGVFFIYLNR